MIINTNKERVAKLKVSLKKATDEVAQLKQQLADIKPNKPKTREEGVQTYKIPEQKTSLPKAILDWSKITLAPKDQKEKMSIFGSRRNKSVDLRDYDGELDESKKDVIIEKLKQQIQKQQIEFQNKNAEYCTTIDKISLKVDELERLKTENLRLKKELKQKEMKTNFSVEKLDILQNP